jgi:hypothetical protein
VDFFGLSTIAIFKIFVFLKMGLYKHFALHAIAPEIFGQVFGIDF